jgi:putative flippase GtrA
MTPRDLVLEAKRLGGFFAVSAINTLFGYAAYAVFLFIGLTPSMALVAGYIAGVFFNFGSFGALFGAQNGQGFPRYLATCGIMLACNLLLLNGLIQIHISALIAQGIAVILLSPVSYVLMRRFVFEVPS